MGKKADGRPQSILVKKKKDKSTKEGSRIGRILGFNDEADSKSVRSGRSAMGKKKKSKDQSTKKSTVEETPNKKKKKEASRDLASQKLSKKKKKKTPSSAGSGSEDAVVSDNRSMDWTNRCILKTRSETTRGS